MKTVRIPARRHRPQYRALPVKLPVWLRHQVPGQLSLPTPPDPSATGQTPA